MKKRVLSFLLAVIICFNIIPVYGNTSRSDITDHWAEPTLRKWSEKGWFNGYGNDTFKPNGSITRAEFIALVNRMKGYSEKSEKISDFTDVSKTDWYYESISTAIAAGYISGTSDGNMSPNKPITRQEAFSILARIAKVSTDNADILTQVKDGDKISEWAKPFVAASVNYPLA